MVSKVLVTIPSTFEKFTSRFHKKLGHEFEVEVKLIDKNMRSSELVKSLKDVEYFISGGIEQVNSEVLNSLEKLRLIARFGVGYDNVDLKTASMKGVYVTNAPGANADSVAEHAIGLMLSSVRHIPYSHNLVAEERWQFVIGEELTRKSLGIVGLGEIGKAVARKVQGFEMKIYAYDIKKDYEFATKYGVEYLSLENLLENSKVVTIHVPLTSQTRNLISRKELQVMKQNAYLINTSRGEVVDQEELIKTLKKRDIKGAALDVFETEPLPPESPLCRMKHVIHTPHIGGSTIEAIQKLIDITTDNVKTVKLGKIPNFVVNKGILKD